jgi:hypothetical protein
VDVAERPSPTAGGERPHRGQHLQRKIDAVTADAVVLPNVFSGATPPWPPGWPGAAVGAEEFKATTSPANQG